MHSAHEKRSGHTKKRQGYPDVLCYARRYTRRSTPVLAGQGAAAAAKLSHDETKATAAKPPLPAAILVLDASLQRGQNQFDIDWILQSSARCASVCRYMETMMESYQNMAAHRSEEEKRCRRLLQSRYLSPFEKSRTSLCEQEHISKSTFYRYEACAVKHLSVFLFGVVAGM